MPTPTIVPAIFPALTIHHDDRGLPDFTLSTRQPTRYDVPSTGSGPVPEYRDENAAPGRLRLRADGHGGVSLELNAWTEDPDEHVRVVLVIDRDDFATWAEQVGHLRDRIRQGY